MHSDKETGSADGVCANRTRRWRWELKFTTRVALLFGLLGLLALVATMGISMRMAENRLESEIHNSLVQRHRAIEGLLQTRLDLLKVYLRSASSNRVFSSLVARHGDLEQLAEDMSYLFQDSAMQSDLDVFFLTNVTGDLVMDAGMPLYDIKPLLAALRSPIHYANTWRLVGEGGRAVLLRALPIFDPATIQLRGYMFIGLAIGQNRYFLQSIAQRVDVEVLKIGYGNEVLIRHAQVPFRTRMPENLEFDRFARHDGVYVMRKLLTLEGIEDPLWVEFGLADSRFAPVRDTHRESFFLVSGGFLVLLLLATWILRITHERAIGRLTRYIEASQTGARGVRFAHGGVREYNQLGDAMQRMVDDLNVAATVFESAEGMVVTDRRGTILRVNAAFCRITGYAAEEAAGKALLSIIPPRDPDPEVRKAIESKLKRDGTWQGEYWCARKNGQVYPQWTNITAVTDHDGSQVQNYVVTLVDATQRKAAETRIEQLAFYDQLTHLPNRQLLMERLSKALVNSTRSGQYGAVLYIDLDDFKTLNDTRGHDVGDQLLRLVAVRLLACVRRSDTAARIGGDEFILLLEGLGKEDDVASRSAEAVCSEVLASLRKPYRFDGVEYFSTLSIGIALFHGETESVDELLKQADLAMYQAKAAGRNTRRFFSPQMQARVLEHAALADDIRQSLQRDEFVLYFQPQFNYRGEATGAEVLLRWRHPVRGMTSPAEIIPVAESTGLIVPLGQWVLEGACRELAHWATVPAMAHMTLAVNISARQLHQPDFVERIVAALEQSGADPARLKLEITESMLLQDVDDTIAKMMRLKDLGVRFALDDFGTGYSSLSYLKRLPLDQLKIDQSFVRDLLADSHDADIARTIVSLAQSLNIAAIAEGVETLDQRDRLAAYGCMAYQGYLFSRPVPVEELYRVVCEAHQQLAGD